MRGGPGGGVIGRKLFYFENAKLSVSHLKWVASEGGRKVSKYMVGDSCFTV